MDLREIRGMELAETRTIVSEMDVVGSVAIGKTSCTESIDCRNTDVRRVPILNVGARRASTLLRRDVMQIKQEQNADGTPRSQRA